MNFGAAIVASSPSGVSAALSCTTARRRDRGNKGRAAAGEGDHPPVRTARDGRLAAPELVRGRKIGKPRPASARDPFRARGRSPFGIWKPAWTPISTQPTSVRNEDLLFRSAAGRTGTLEPHRTLAHGPKPYERRGNAIRADEVERIRIWRGFLIDAKNTLHIRSAKTAKTRPLARSRRRWIRGPRSGLRPPCLTHPATLSHPDWRGRSRLPYG